jgi:predicted phosphodiesterase
MRKIFFWFLILASGFLKAEITRFPHLLPTENLEQEVGIAWRMMNEEKEQVLYYREEGTTSWQEQRVLPERIFYWIKFMGENLPNEEITIYEFQVQTNENPYSATFTFELHRINWGKRAKKLKDAYDGNYPILGLFSKPVVTAHCYEVPYRVKIRIITQPDIERVKIRMKRRNASEDWQEFTLTQNREVLYYTKLTNLRPGTRYEYKIGEDGEVSQFRTSSWADDFSFKVLIIADTHFDSAENTEEPSNVLEIIDEMKAVGADLILVCGDLCHGKTEWQSYDEEFQNAMYILRDLAKNAIFCPYPGNHDSNGNEWHNEIFADQFYFPPNGPEGKGRENYFVKEACYFFRYGGIQVMPMSLGVLSFGSEVVPYKIEDVHQWFGETCELGLQKGVRNFIGCGHWIPYTPKDTHLIDEEEMERFLANLNRYQFAICFGGHYHSHRRQKHDEVIYHCVAGAEGRNYVVMEVSRGGRELTVRSYRENSQQDYYQVERDLSLTISPSFLKGKNIFGSYPNPFNPECYIPLNVKSKRQNVKCKIYNILGQLVREIECSGAQELKDSRVYWDGKDNQGLEVPSGVYFYEVEGEGIRQMVGLR